MKAIAMNESDGGYQEMTGFTRVRGNRDLGGHAGSAYWDRVLGEMMDILGGPGSSDYDVLFGFSSEGGGSTNGEQELNSQDASDLNTGGCCPGLTGILEKAWERSVVGSILGPEGRAAAFIGLLIWSYGGQIADYLNKSLDQSIDKMLNGLKDRINSVWIIRAAVTAYLADKFGPGNYKLYELFASAPGEYPNFVAKSGIFKTFSLQVEWKYLNANDTWKYGVTGKENVIGNSFLNSRYIEGVNLPGGLKSNVLATGNYFQVRFLESLYINKFWADHGYYPPGNKVPW